MHYFDFVFDKMGRFERDERGTIVQKEGEKEVVVEMMKSLEKQLLER